MKKIILAIVLIAVVVMITACGRTTKSDTTTTQEGNTTTTTTTDGETITTTVSGTEGADSWCPEGGDWNVKVKGIEGAGEASWKIDKMMAGGQFDGLCHVIYTATSDQGDVVIDYYFNEDGTEGYFEMDVNGEKITQKWHSE